MCEGNYNSHPTYSLRDYHRHLGSKGPGPSIHSGSSGYSGRVAVRTRPGRQGRTKILTLGPFASPWGSMSLETPPF